MITLGALSSSGCQKSSGIVTAARDQKDAEASNHVPPSAGRECRIYYGGLEDPGQRESLGSQIGSSMSGLSC